MRRTSKAIDTIANVIMGLVIFVCVIGLVLMIISAAKQIPLALIPILLYTIVSAGSLLILFFLVKGYATIVEASEAYLDERKWKYSSRHIADSDEEIQDNLRNLKHMR